MEQLTGQAFALRIMRASLASDRLAGVYLLHGPLGVGKRTLARHFARTILCRDAAGDDRVDACGQCRSCQLAEHNHHPALHLISPDVDGAGNLIHTAEIIRAIFDVAEVRPAEGGHRVFVIEEVHAARIETANMMLKLLEEPPDYAVFLLTSSNLDAVLLTVRSRSQLLRVTPSPQEEVAQLLDRQGIGVEQARLAARLADGCPGLATQMLDEQYQQLRQSAVGLLQAALTEGEAVALGDTAAFKGQRQQALALVQVLQSLMRDVVLLRAGAAEKLLRNIDLCTSVANILKPLATNQLLEAWRSTFQMEEDLAGNANLQLLLDDWLIGLIKAADAGRS